MTVNKQPVLTHMVRQVPEQFSWIDHRLVREHYIDHLKHQASALYLFLVKVSDSQGLSYYSDTTLGKKPLLKIPNDLTVIKILSSYGKNILAEEKSFLKKANKLGRNDNEKEYGKLVEAHNKNAESQIRLAEREIISFFALDKKDTVHIYESLDHLGYYTYNVLDCIDEIVKKD